MREERIMKKDVTHHGIRSNPVGDWPEIDSTAFVDPSAQIIGKVHIGPNVYVAPLAVIRADEADTEGKVHPIIIEADTHIQDGTIIHSRGGTMVTIGPRASIAHGVMIHGPCIIGEGCFLALRAVLYSATLEDYVWVGIGSIIMKATIPSHTMIPAGSVIRAGSDVRHFRLTNNKEEEYQANVFSAATALRHGYIGLYGSTASGKEG
jgi:carbonic anhydrase/acetyltransferase-like protein (isoleucine patch superfamily)